MTGITEVHGTFCQVDACDEHCDEHALVVVLEQELVDPGGDFHRRMALLRHNPEDVACDGHEQRGWHTLA